MSSFSDIDINKSIVTGRLIRKRTSSSVINRISFLVLCLCWMTIAIMLFFKFGLANANSNVIVFYLFFLITLFVVYIFYRKLNESQLIKIETPFYISKNKELLLDFLRQKSYEISRQCKEVVIVNNEEDLSHSSFWTKEITFIIADKAIYFNVVKNYPRLNPPILLTHIFLNKELKTFFNNIEINRKF